MKTTTLTIDVTFNGQIYSTDYETGNDLNSFIVDFINETIDEINDEEESELGYITDIKEITYEVTDWGEVEEYGNLKDIDLLNEIAEETISYGWDVINAAIECDIQISDIDEAYQGEYKDDEDFAESICTEVGDIPSDLPSYIHIDWERTSGDIMMDYSESDGHYFRCL